MARKNNSRHQIKRYRNTPLTGDPSPLKAPTYTDSQLIGDLTVDDIDNMTEDQIFNLGLALGGSAVELLGIDHCYEHYGMLLMQGASGGKFKYSTDVVYCKNCWNYFREKSIKVN